MSEGEVRMWNGQAWDWSPPPLRNSGGWDRLVADVLRLLARRDITPVQAESWLWMLVELEEARAR